MSSNLRENAVFALLWGVDQENVIQLIYLTAVT